MTTIADPRQDEIDAFWTEARMRANLNRLEVYCGPTELDSLQPPASSFGGSREVADKLADLIVAGTKTATSSAVWDWEADGDDVPRRGDLEIVLDGSGHPRALIVTTAVEIVPFDEVDAEHASVRQVDGISTKLPDASGGQVVRRPDTSMPRAVAHSRARSASSRFPARTSER